MAPASRAFVSPMTSRCGSRTPTWTRCRSLNHRSGPRRATGGGARPAANGRGGTSGMSADLSIPVTSVTPFFVEEHDRQVELVMYGVQGNTDIINYPTGDTLIKSVTWEQESNDRIRFTMHLTQRPTGWMAVMEGGRVV